MGSERNSTDHRQSLTGVKPLKNDLITPLVVLNRQIKVSVWKCWMHITCVYKEDNITAV